MAPVITPPTRVAGPTLSGAELYDLLVPDPTEEFLAELAERERMAGPPGGEHPVVGIDPGPGPVTAADPTEPAAAAATGPDLDPAEPAGDTTDRSSSPDDPDRDAGS